MKLGVMFSLGVFVLSNHVHAMSLFWTPLELPKSEIVYQDRLWKDVEPEVSTYLERVTKKTEMCDGALLQSIVRHFIYKVKDSEAFDWAYAKALDGCLPILLELETYFHHLYMNNALDIQLFEMNAKLMMLRMLIYLEEAHVYLMVASTDRQIFDILNMSIIKKLQREYQLRWGKILDLISYKDIFDVIANHRKSADHKETLNHVRVDSVISLNLPQLFVCKKTTGNDWSKLKATCKGIHRKAYTENSLRLMKECGSWAKLLNDDLVISVC